MKVKNKYEYEDSYLKNKNQFLTDKINRRIEPPAIVCYWNLLF